MKFLVIPAENSYNKKDPVYIKAQSITGFSANFYDNKKTELWCGTDSFTLNVTVEDLTFIMLDSKNYVEFPELG